ncbi:chemotaxis protein CheB [Rugamonas sp.]|uniref:chemotaxis protein CheB n=1 Tax=Rugamonas sp. TaxID=1926287 RepID=UPI0025F15876|nr:chemotaxis protein CheB [Rugamonas sp.]
MQKLIVIGASAGGVNALTSVTSALPANLRATVLIVMHIGARRSLLPEILQKLCPLPVKHAEDCLPLLPGQVLIAPPDRHLTVEIHDGQPRARLWRGPKEHYTRPAIDPLFRSAAAAFDGLVIAAILTGYLDDGTAGLHAVKTCGGYAIVQDPKDAQVPDMPASALSYVTVDNVLPLCEIGPMLTALAAHAPQWPAGAGVGAADRKPQPPEWMRVENRYVRGVGDIEDLQRIGIPSGYTCPECNGALWKLNDVIPPRFRCHTGHSFSARVLAELQDDTVEAALWSSLRALQEKARMVQELFEDAAVLQDPESKERHRQHALKLQADIATLHALLSK